MPVTRLHTGFNIEVEFTISPFHKRLFAWIIDLIIICFYLWLRYQLLVSLSATTYLFSTDWLQLLTWIPVLVYHLFFELFANGQSPGKKLMAIKVIASSGGQPTTSQFLIRWMFRTIDFPLWILVSLLYGNWPWYLFFFLFSGLGSYILTALGQRVGDLLADTMVIDTRSKADWKHTVFMEVEDAYEPFFPQVMGLSDRDMNTIKQVLLYTNKKTDELVLLRVASKIKTALKIETDLEPLDFLSTLLKDYNFMSRK